MRKNAAEETEHLGILGSIWSRGSHVRNVQKGRERTDDGETAEDELDKI